MKKALIPVLLVPLAGNALAAATDGCLDLDTAMEMQRCAQGHNPTARVVMHQGRPVILDKITSIDGDYLEYAGNPASQMNAMIVDQVNETFAQMNSVLLEKELENRGQVLRGKITKVDIEDQSYGLTFSGEDDGSDPYRGALMLSSFGPDVSGRDILTWHHKQRLGEGYVATFAATHGFSDLRTESKGGSYESFFADLEKSTPFGLANISYSYTDNEAGGDSLIYVLGGKTHRYSASLTNWVGRTGWRYAPKIEHTRRKQEMGVFDLYTKQQYTSSIIDVGYDSSAIGFQVKAKKGVSGDQDINLIPLLGSFNPYYWSMDINASGQLSLGEKTSLKARLEGFKGSIDMPSSERIGLGGVGAGSSHESGLYSGYKGFQHEVVIYQLLHREGRTSLTARAGINGSEVKTALDEGIRLQSAEIGLDLGFGSWALNTSYSKSIMTHGLDADQRVNAQVVWRY